MNRVVSSRKACDTAGNDVGATLRDGEIFHFHNMSQFHGNTCQSRAERVEKHTFTNDWTNACMFA